MKRLLLLLCLAISMAANGQQIAYGEYFYDTDPGVGNGINLPTGALSDSIDLNALVSINGLSNGVHELFIRLKDTSGKWSMFDGSLIYVYPLISVSAFNPQIVAAEYFFDNDPGVGNATNLPTGTLSDSIDLNTSLSTNGLSAGIHTFFVRVKDNYGKWSMFDGVLFYVYPPNNGNVPTGDPKIVAAEYFIDTDPGVGNATNFPTGALSDSIDLTKKVNVSGLASGVHKLFVRVKDTSGHWSMFDGTLFYVYPNNITPPNTNPKIVNAEYFIDIDPGVGNGNGLPTGALSDSININTAIAANSLNVGVHTLFVRVKDDNGKWGMFDGVNFTKINCSSPLASPTITGNTNYCGGSTINLSISPVAGAVGYFWKTPNGNNISGANLTITNATLTNAGTYYGYAYKISAVGSSCDTNLTSVVVNVLNYPVATIAPSNSISICPGSNTFLTASGGNSYLWSSGDTSRSVYVSQAGNYYVIASNACGVDTSDMVNVSLNPFYNCYCSSQATNVWDEEIYSITINNANSLVLTGTIDPCTTLAPGPGSILNRYSNYTSSGAFFALTKGSTAAFTIEENECDGPTYYAFGAAIWIDFNHNGSFDDPGEQVYSENNTVLGPRTINTAYTIPYSAVTGVTGMRVVVAEGLSGSALTPCTTYGYGETEDYLVNIIPDSLCNGTPNVGMISAPASICMGTDFWLTDSTFSTDQGIVFQWLMSPQGQNSWTPIPNANTPNFNYAGLGGNTDFKLVATCLASGFVSTSNIITVNVYPIVTPTASITASANNICTGTAVTFTANTSGGGNNPIDKWYINGNLVGSGNAYTSNTLNDGDVVSFALISDALCATSQIAHSNEITMMVNATITPTVSINTVDSSICAGDMVSIFSNASGGGVTPGYQWFVNGNAIAGATNPIYSSASFNNGDVVRLDYTTSVTCATQPFASSNNLVLTVHALPNVSAGPNVQVCQGNAVLLAGSGAVSYVWSNGVMDNQPFIPDTTRTYSVIGTDNKGCSSTSHVTVSVNPLPTIDAGADLAICLGSNVFLNATSNAFITWSNGVGNNQFFQAVSSGNLIATATNAAGCVNTDTLYLDVLPLPIIDAGPNRTICAGDSVSLQGAGGNQYFWTGGIIDHQSFFPANTQQYVVTGYALNGCSNTDSVVVHVNPLPNVNAGSDVSVCYGKSVTLIASGALSYSWNRDVVNNQSFVPLNTVDYVVSGIDSNGCSNSDTVTVHVLPLPIAHVSTTYALICQGGNVAVTASGGGSYLWSNGDTAATTVFTQAGNYYVVVTNANGCVDTSDKVTVEVKPIPAVVKIKIIGLTTVCNPSTVSFRVDPSASTMYGFSFQWNLGGVPIPGATDTAYTASGAGGGNVSLTISGGSCTKTSGGKVYLIKPLPLASFTPSGPTTICSGDNLVFTAPSVQGYIYTWLKDGAAFGSGTTKSIKLSGSYVVIAKLNGCADTSAPVNVIINPLPNDSIYAVTPATFCAGDSCRLSAKPADGTKFYWYSGVNVIDSTVVSSYFTKVAGVYKVVVIAANGCVGRLSVTKVTTKVNPIPMPTITPSGANIIIAANGNVKLKATPASGVSWQWYKNNVAIAGAIAATYTATTAGSYTVAVTKLGCTGFSAATVVQQNGVKEESTAIGSSENSFEIAAYPNPVNNDLTVSIRGLEEATNAQIQMMDMNGRLLGSWQLVANSLTINMHDYANGVYFVRYTDEQGRTGTVKVVKE